MIFIATAFPTRVPWFLNLKMGSKLSHCDLCHFGNMKGGLMVSIRQDNIDEFFIRYPVNVRG